MSLSTIPILGHGTLPDPAGAAFFESSEIALTNGLHPRSVAAFPNSGAKDGIASGFRVPDDYSSATTDPIVKAIWSSATTTGAANLVFDYNSIAIGETLDPSSDQESVNQTDTAPATLWFMVQTLLTLTRTNLTAQDELLFTISRDSAAAGDTLADSIYLWSLSFTYDNA